MLASRLINGEDVTLASDIKQEFRGSACRNAQDARIKVGRPDDPRTMEGAVGAFGESATPNGGRTPSMPPQEGL